MKILYYEWKENSQNDMVTTLKTMGYSVLKCHIPCHDYEYDILFMERFEAAAVKYQCDVIFTFDYFPVIAKVAKKLQIDYLSWVYDSPHWTLFSPTVWSERNYIFVFDYQQYLILKDREVPHVYHLPLAVNTRRLNRQLALPSRELEFKAEVSFVGSLYEKNLYNQIVYLPDWLKGYLDGIMDVQKKIFGVNILKEIIPGSAAEKLGKYVKMDMDDSYRIAKYLLYVDMLNEKLTSIERIEYLNRISRNYKLSLYTGSNASLVPAAVCRGTVSYEEEMPKVFLLSKINLNVTHRSIESGIPLRALDILGSGGFLLSNYQPELAQYFVNEEEVVMYEGEEDLLEKTEYYMKQDKKRTEIARNGWEKVQKQFSYEMQVERMLGIWRSERKRV